jgi:cytidylate kinase
MDSGRAGDQLLIAIDGPAASGKSTVALALARQLGLALVDSGSMYRAVTLLALENNTPVDDEAALVEIAREVSATFKLELRDGGALRVFVQDREVTEPIRSPRVGGFVSPVSEVAGVRAERVRLQRCLTEGRGAVVEGRDIGTTVLPDAQMKVFLEASQGVRARRRLAEFKEKGVEATLATVTSEIKDRDRIDSSRAVSPLRAAPDAVSIDTSHKTVATVVDEIVGLLADRGLVH